MRVARMLNGEKRHGASLRLSRLTGASTATVKGWQAEEGAEHRRSTSATAQKLLSLLVYLHAEEILNDDVIAKVNRIEAHLVAGRGRLDQFIGELTGKRMVPDEDQD